MRIDNTAKFLDFFSINLATHDAEGLFPCSVFKIKTCFLYNTMSDVTQFIVRYFMSKNKCQLIFIFNTIQQSYGYGINPLTITYGVHVRAG